MARGCWGGRLCTPPRQRRRRQPLPIKPHHLAKALREQAVDLGAGAGAVAGSAIARTASPDCPPGFVVKAAPEPFYPPPVYPHVYVAPPWYDPWVWYGGHWIYRPYPYHRYWYKRHWRRR